MKKWLMFLPMMVLLEFNADADNAAVEPESTNEQGEVLSDGNEDQEFSIEESAAVQSVRGVGMGYMHLIHFDYSRMIQPDRSIDISITPLLMLNIGTVGVSQYYLPRNQLFVSPNVMVFVGIMDGSPAIGPGLRVGYQFLGDNIGIKAYIGGNVLWTSMNRIEPVPDVGMTLLRVKR